MDKNMTLSIVIPCYRSEFTIPYVVDGIKETMEEHPEIDYEIILVCDGSPDDTFEVVSALAKNNHHIKAVELSRNFGQHSALMAGYSLASGDYIVGMDDDGEHNPRDMFLLIAELEKGYDYVCARFPNTDHSKLKKIGSKINDWMATKFIGKPKGAIFSSYYVMRQYVIREIVKTNNPNPYVGGMLVSITKKLSSVTIQHHIRKSGQSNYNLKNSISLWLNGITSFSVRPLRFAALVGIIFIVLGFSFMAFIVIRKLVAPEIAAGYSSMVSIGLFSSGVIMLILEMIGEYVGRIYMLVNLIPQYVIKSVVTKSFKEDNVAKISSCTKDENNKPS